MEIMDNFALNVRARTRESFDSAMKIALSAHSRATHWCVHPDFGLVLFWSDPDSEFHGRKVHPLPLEMDFEAASYFAWEWLHEKNIKRENFNLKGMDAKYDGQAWNEAGWRMYVEDWGHVGGSPYAVCAILPVWAWVGK